MTYVQGQCEMDGMKRRLTQRRKDAKKDKNGPFLGREETALLCAFAALREPAVASTEKRRLTQRRQDAKKGKNGLPLGTEEKALLRVPCGLARPCRCLKRWLTQRRQDAKKGRRHSGTQSLSHFVTQSLTPQLPRHPSPSQEGRQGSKWRCGITCRRGPGAFRRARTGGRWRTIRPRPA